MNTRTRRANISTAKDFSKQIKNQKDDVLLARLQSGHHTSLHHYLHQIDPIQDPICPSCRLDEQDLAHLLCKCLAGEIIRWQVFVYHSTWGCTGIRKDTRKHTHTYTHTEMVSPAGFFRLFIFVFVFFRYSKNSSKRPRLSFLPGH